MVPSKPTCIAVTSPKFTGMQLHPTKLELIVQAGDLRKVARQAIKGLAHDDVEVPQFGVCIICLDTRDDESLAPLIARSE